MFIMYTTTTEHKMIITINGIKTNMDSKVLIQLIRSGAFTEDTEIISSICETVFKWNGKTEGPVDSIWILVSTK